MRRWSALAVVLACASCQQILGIQDPTGAASSGSDHPDAGAPHMDGRGGPDTFGHDSGSNVGCATAPAWKTPAMYSAAGGLALAAGDLNHDGIRDVAVVTTSDVLVFPGTTGGGGYTFSASHALRPGNAITATNVLVHDLDGDGFDDVVTWQSSGPLGGGTTVVSVFMQQAGAPGTFSAPRTLNLSNEPKSGIVAANVDGDTRTDLVVSDGSDVDVFLSAGSGAFTGPTRVHAQPSSLDAVDIDGDALDDLVISSGSTVELYYNQGAGYGSGVALGANARGAVFGHFSAGALRDAFLITGAGTTAVFHQVSARTFDETNSSGPLGFHPWQVGEPHLALDVNHDGADDLVIVNDVALQCPAALGTFATQQGTPSQTPSAASGTGLVLDLDADGRADYVTFDSNMPTGASFVVVYLAQ